MNCFGIRGQLQPGATKQRAILVKRIARFRLSKKAKKQKKRPGKSLKKEWRLHPQVRVGAVRRLPCG